MGVTFSLDVAAAFLLVVIIAFLYVTSAELSLIGSDAAAAGRVKGNLRVLYY